MRIFHKQDIVTPPLSVFAVIRIAREKRARQAGFSYTAVRLLSGATVSQIREEIEREGGFFADPFYDGVLDAFDAWNKLQVGVPKM